MTAEESIENFIKYLEESGGAEITDIRKEWLHRKGQEIFDTYYITNVAKVNLATQKDKDDLMKYFATVQETLGKMFAHIMLIEFKLYLLTDE
jgi:hypothetical protein